MLSGVRIFTSDSIWRQILSDFGATVLDATTPIDINFDKIAPKSRISPLELKALILNAGDAAHILHIVFGRVPTLSRIQTQIVVLLYQTGGMTISGLNSALGYSPDATTHTVDTAIYQLRKVYGHSFIINKNGVYTLGKI